MARNPERFAIGIVIILILALTPLIAWLLLTVGVNDQWWAKYAVRIATGIFIYIAALYAISGLYDDETVEVEGEDKGKLTVNRFMLLAGIIVVAVGWLTDVSAWIVSYFHLTFQFEFIGITYRNTSIVERLIISVFTIVGAFLIKHSIGRKERTETAWPDANELYEKTKKR
jgi:uncharacterized membrane protein